MKALISSIEPRETGYRVAQVEEDDNIFPVAEPVMFWVNCTDNIIADKFWYDPLNESIKPIPVPVVLDPVPEPDTSA